MRSFHSLTRFLAALDSGLVSSLAVSRHSLSSLVAVCKQRPPMRL
jgi:hypothetical protein